MARYIDADAYEYPGDLINVPTADVAEVEHGEWVFSRKEWGSSDYSQDVYYKCSICGKEYEEFDIDEAKHCPECGAKMDGRSDT